MTKKFIKVSVFTLFSLGVSANATNYLAPCAQTRFSEPSASAAVLGGRGSRQAPDCRRSIYVTARDTTRIWRCYQVDRETTRRDGEAGNGFIIQRSGIPMRFLPHDMLPDTDRNFELIEVDLNADASREYVLAVWNGVSNGMGVHSWTIYVFDARWKLVKRFDDVSDWGRSSLVAAPAGRAGCDIAVTSYQTVTPGRGSDYKVLRARLFAGRVLPAAPVLALSLQEAADRPTLDRRYSSAFERERTIWFSRDTWQWRGNIATWLNNPATISRRTASAR